MTPSLSTADFQNGKCDRRPAQTNGESHPITLDYPWHLYTKLQSFHNSSFLLLSTAATSVCIYESLLCTSMCLCVNIHVYKCTSYQQAYVQMMMQLTTQTLHCECFSGACLPICKDGAIKTLEHRVYQVMHSFIIQILLLRAGHTENQVSTWPMDLMSVTYN